MLFGLQYVEASSQDLIMCLLSSPWKEKVMLVMFGHVSFYFFPFLCFSLAN